MFLVNLCSKQVRTYRDKGFARPHGITIEFLDILDVGLRDQQSTWSDDRDPVDSSRLSIGILHS